MLRRRVRRGGEAAAGYLTLAACALVTLQHTHHGMTTEPEQQPPSYVPRQSQRLVTLATQQQRRQPLPPVLGASFSLSAPSWRRKRSLAAAACGLGLSFLCQPGQPAQGAEYQGGGIAGTKTAESRAPGISEFFQAMAEASGNITMLHETLAQLRKTPEGLRVVRRLKAAHAANGTRGLRNELITHPEARQALLNVHRDLSKPSSGSRLQVNPDTGEVLDPSIVTTTVTAPPTPSAESSSGVQSPPSLTDSSPKEPPPPPPPPPLSQASVQEEQLSPSASAPPTSAPANSEIIENQDTHHTSTAVGTEMETGKEIEAEEVDDKDGEEGASEKQGEIKDEAATSLDAPPEPPTPAPTPEVSLAIEGERNATATPVAPALTSPLAEANASDTTANRTAESSAIVQEEGEEGKPDSFAKEDDCEDGEDEFDDEYYDETEEGKEAAVDLSNEEELDEDELDALSVALQGKPWNETKESVTRESEPADPENLPKYIRDLVNYGFVRQRPLPSDSLENLRRSELKKEMEERAPLEVVFATVEILLKDTSKEMKEAFRTLAENAERFQRQQKAGVLTDFDPHVLFEDPKLAGDNKDLAAVANVFVDYHLSRGTFREEEKGAGEGSAASEQQGDSPSHPLAALREKYPLKPEATEKVSVAFSAKDVEGFDREVSRILMQYIELTRKVLNAVESSPKATRIFLRDRESLDQELKTLSDLRFRLEHGETVGYGDDPIEEASSSSLKRAARNIFSDVLRNLTTDSDSDLPENRHPEFYKRPPSYEEYQEQIAQGIMEKYGISREIYNDMCLTWEPFLVGEHITLHHNQLDENLVLKQKKMFSHLFDPDMVDHPIDCYLAQRNAEWSRTRMNWFFEGMKREDITRLLMDDDARTQILNQPIIPTEEEFQESVALHRKRWQTREMKERIDALPDPERWKEESVKKLRRSFEQEKEIIEKQAIRNFQSWMKTQSPAERLNLLRKMRKIGINATTDQEVNELQMLRYMQETMLRLPAPKNDLFLAAKQKDVEQTIRELKDYRNGGPAATDDEGRNVLHYFASMEVNPDAILVMIKEGVPWQATDNLGNTILHYAAAYDRKQIVQVIRNNIEGSHWLTMIRNQKNLTPFDAAVQRNGYIAKDAKTLSLLDPNFRKTSSALKADVDYVDALERLGFSRKIAAIALSFARNSLTTASAICKNFPEEKILEMEGKLPLPRYICANPPGPAYTDFELENRLEELAGIYSLRIFENVTSVEIEKLGKLRMEVYQKILHKLKIRARGVYHAVGDMSDFHDYDLLRYIRVYMGWESPWSFFEDELDSGAFIAADWLEKQPRYLYLCDQPNKEERQSRLRTGLKDVLMKLAPDIVKGRVRRIFKALKRKPKEARFRKSIFGTDTLRLQEALKEVSRAKAMGQVPRSIKEEAIDRVVDAIYPLRGYPFVDRARTPINA